MTNPRNRLFRQKALEHLSSPDQLDQAVQIIHPRAWIPLFALGGLIMVGGIWSVVGQLPIKVTGQGVLVNPRRMIQFQSPIAGQLKTL
ncbi:MAG: NHLP bacteriocin system secretion protein, partial [Cyanobacteria bacterium J06659_2]